MATRRRRRGARSGGAPSRCPLRPRRGMPSGPRRGRSRERPEAPCRSPWPAARVDRRDRLRPANRGRPRATARPHRRHGHPLRRSTARSRRSSRCRRTRGCSKACARRCWRSAIAAGSSASSAAAAWRTEARVGIDGVAYAGNHGMEMQRAGDPAEMAEGVAAHVAVIAAFAPRGRPTRLEAGRPAHGGEGRDPERPRERRARPGRGAAAARADRLRGARPGPGADGGPRGAGDAPAGGGGQGHGGAHAAARLRGAGGAVHRRRPHRRRRLAAPCGRCAPRASSTPRWAWRCAAARCAPAVREAADVEVAGAAGALASCAGSFTRSPRGRRRRRRGAARASRRARPVPCVADVLGPRPRAPRDQHGEAHQVEGRARSARRRPA